MFNSPTIVIGPPRSGTTMTARVLQERFGILMDGAPMKPDKMVNPYGWYEDRRVVEANSLLSRGMISHNAWDRKFKRYIRAMEKLNRPWGFKDPRIIPFLGHALTFFKSPTIIRCHRLKELVIKSYIEKLKWGKEMALKRYDWDEKALDYLLKGRVHYCINFDKYILEETIVQFFQDKKILKYAA